MRAAKPEKPKKKNNHNCSLCKGGRCIDEAPKAIFRINPQYPGRVTRSITKVLKYINDFIIVEIYRCMPLLGDEKEKVPDWDVHIVKYAIVFTHKN